MQREHHTDVDLSELRVDSLDTVDPVELHEQLQSMNRISDLWYHTDNGFFAGVTVEFAENGQDMVAEAMHQHGLRYEQSYYNQDRERHRVVFKTDVEIEGMLHTSVETQTQMESVGEPF
jgi:hypothetical protein